MPEIVIVELRVNLCFERARLQFAPSNLSLGNQRFTARESPYLANARVSAIRSIFSI